MQNNNLNINTLDSIQGGVKTNSNERINYIDIARGIGIIGVAWIHTSPPAWLTPDIVNSIFFFLSGIFFKPKPLQNVLKKWIRTLIIPFLFFYLLSYPFRVLMHFWDTRTLETFNWLCLFDIFKIEERSDYLFVNVPLWFILCLLMIQAIYSLLQQLDQRILFILALLCILFKDILLNFPSPFMINNALYWINFYIMGHLFGKKILRLLQDSKKRLYFTGTVLTLYALFILPFFKINSYIPANLLHHAYLYTIILSLISLSSFFNRDSSLKTIRFFGINSLIVLGIHILFEIPLKRIEYSLLHEHTLIISIIITAITLFLCYHFAIWANKHIPHLVGKS